MPNRLTPLNIAVIGGDVAIAWNDGKESYIPVETLRKSCPCAACCGEPDALGKVVRPEVVHTPESFQLRVWQLVGGYALQPGWGDGHSSGLYSFPYLRKIAGTE